VAGRRRIFRGLMGSPPLSFRPRAGDPVPQVAKLIRMGYEVERGTNAQTTPAEAAPGYRRDATPPGLNVQAEDARHQRSRNPVQKVRIIGAPLTSN
jgi:hypothetical protein